MKSSLRLLISGIRRLTLDGGNVERNLKIENNENRIFWGDVTNVKEKLLINEQTKALSAEIIQSCRDLIQINQLYREAVHQILSQGVRVVDDAAFLADFGGALSSGFVWRSVSYKSKKELQLSRIQQDIGKKVEEKVRKAHEDHMLREQLKVIKKQLGMEKDDKETVIQKFRDAIKDKIIPEAVKTVIDNELGRLEFLEPAASEFQVARNYLDWLTVLPWGTETDDTLDQNTAQTILDEDHYGMNDVKDRILEFICTSQLRGSVQGKILCFHGPPGTGKTSIAKSIARSLGRKYYRFSVGGMSDVAEIKGHRRTYVGAMPGKLVQCLKKTESENPLILIDEIDKLGRGYQGDPSSALLELLDPEQNVGFLDHYLDVPIDLSKALFICTANDLSTISGPLRDRMEMIEVAGYITDEKVEIAKKYLIPKSHEETGITEKDISFSRDALVYLIDKHCRESGVRNLRKHIEKIFRKASRKVVNGEKVEVTIDNLKDFVGPAVFTKDRMYDDPPAGTVCGLAWTSMGGSALYVETAVVESSDGKGTLKVTGNIKDVMKESTSIAYTVAKNILAGTKHADFFKNNNLHLHFPEGATPKDGPSAGVTIVSALLSLATVPIQDVAMTGEISLNKKVLAVGGIKEKILAAKRAEIKKVFLPVDCLNEFNKLDDVIKEEIEIVFVKEYREIQDQLFAATDF
ncbi:unnamed protein product [Oikopleura dioica]|uniref:endopeptidase La n=1 Tax=Oikopleura dioica TaxID=34765 RepID=E4XTF9_OIKDI|nr:unnamed protein product [Oikopleura dioica]